MVVSDTDVILTVTEALYYLTFTSSFFDPSSVISLFNHKTPVLSISQDALLLLLLPLTVSRCQSLLSCISPVFLFPPPSTLLPLSLQLSNSSSPLSSFSSFPPHTAMQCGILHQLISPLIYFSLLLHLSLSLSLWICSVRGQVALTAECCDSHSHSYSDVVCFIPCMASELWLNTVKTDLVNPGSKDSFVLIPIFSRCC